jgi:signal transduction histidine kinase
LLRHRVAVAAAWRELSHEVSASYRRMSQARLRERIDAGIDAFIQAAGTDDDEVIQRFLAGLEALIDQEHLAVDEVIGGLLAGCDAFDRALPPDERYLPEVVGVERVIRTVVSRFAESAIGLVTQKLEIEAAAQRESKARILALQRIGAAVTSSLDIEASLETIVTEASALMNGATARLRLADDSGENLKLIASAGELGDEEIGTDVPVETTLAGLCYRSGRPVISNDVASDPRANDDLRRATRTQSLLSVPLISRGTPAGVLSITNVSDRSFEDGDAEMLSLFADHAAVAIENGRFYQQAQRQLTQMEILNRVSAVVSASLDLGSVYTAIHQEIARIMVADAFLILLRNDDGGFDLTYVVDLGQAYAPRHNVNIPKVYFEAMEDRAPIIIDAARHPDFNAWERYGDMSRRVQSVVVAPLLRGTEPVGVITAQAYAADAYRKRDADLLATVANVAAVAIENARLYEQVYGLAVAEERNRLAREIHDTIAQGLVGIILQLEAVSAMVGDDARLRRRIERSIDLARVNLDEARRSVRDLRAAPLEHMSLAEAIIQLADEHRQDCDSDVRVEMPEAMPLLDKSIEATLFRFVQEALTNCRKHARGTEVAIAVVVADLVSVTVKDAGPGFDVESWKRQAPLHHFGLHGMRERAERHGGTFAISSSLGSGTEVQLLLPLRPNA